MKKWVILLAAALLLLTVRARAAELPREAAAEEEANEGEACEEA